MSWTRLNTGLISLVFFASVGPRETAAAPPDSPEAREQAILRLIAVQERDIQRQIAARIQRVSRQTARVDRIVPTSGKQAIQVARRQVVLAQRRTALETQASSPPPGPLLRAIEVRERQLIAQQERMTETIERLDVLAERNPQLASRVAALTDRLELRIQQTERSISRLERLAATPSSP